jgi:hypothetical protein
MCPHRPAIWAGSRAEPLVSESVSPVRVFLCALLQLERRKNIGLGKVCKIEPNREFLYYNKKGRETSEGAKNWMITVLFINQSWALLITNMIIENYQTYCLLPDQK